jgi:ligand-binding sensor domain-containing protein
MGANADSIFNLMQYKSGTIRMGTANGLFSFQISGAGKGNFRARSRENEKNLKEVKSLAMDQSGKIWMGSTEGLFFVETPAAKS